VLDIQKPTSNDNMVFEAAWRPDGATCINRPRWYETLSDIRKECPEKLKGRLNEGSSCTTAQKSRQKWSDALIFNDSLRKQNNHKQVGMESVPVRASMRDRGSRGIYSRQVQDELPALLRTRAPFQEYESTLFPDA
jgi:hypothetical protein